MRKDIFIVGARLLGISLLTAAINPLAFVVSTWFVKYQTTPNALEYNFLNGLVHIIVGLYLLFGTNNLFNFLERILTEEETNKEEKNSAA